MKGIIKRPFLILLVLIIMSNILLLMIETFVNYEIPYCAADDDIEIPITNVPVPSPSRQTVINVPSPSASGGSIGSPTGGTVSTGGSIPGWNPEMKRERYEFPFGNCGTSNKVPLDPSTSPFQFESAEQSSIGGRPYFILTLSIKDAAYCNESANKQCANGLTCAAACNYILRFAVDAFHLPVNHDCIKSSSRRVNSSPCTSEMKTSSPGTGLFSTNKETWQTTNFEWVTCENTTIQMRFNIKQKGFESFMRANTRWYFAIPADYFESRCDWSNICKQTKTSGSIANFPSCAIVPYINSDKPDKDGLKGVPGHGFCPVVPQK